MTINLSNESIFPITRDKNNDIITTDVATSLKTSGTIQGEGALIGVPSLFIRTSGCNLRCFFTSTNFHEPCDTEYTSWFPEQNNYEIDNIIKIIKNNIGQMKHIVITGGEPMLQMESLIELTRRIKNELKLHITIETNGTIFNDDLIEFVDLFSISPKLSNSNPNQIGKYKTKINHNKLRYNLSVLQDFISYQHDEFSNVKLYDIQFKFVVTNKRDIVEIKSEYITKLNNFNNEDIMLMPLGMTVASLNESKHLVLSECITNGWRYTSRLHIELFGNKIGV